MRSHSLHVNYLFFVLLFFIFGALFQWFDKHIFNFNLIYNRFGLNVFYEWYNNMYWTFLSIIRCTSNLFSCWHESVAHFRMCCGMSVFRVHLRISSLFTTVLTFDDPQAEDEESSLPHLDGFQSKLPPGILPHGLPHVKEVEPAVTALEQEKAKQEVKEGPVHCTIQFVFLS